MFKYGQLSLKLRCVHLSVCRRCRDVAGLGAMHVNELRIADWSSLPSFVSLKEMEKRRLLTAVGRCLDNTN